MAGQHVLRIVSLGDDTYVTFLTEPVASDTVLMRTPLSEAVMVLSEIKTLATSLSSRPPTEPILIP